MRYWHEGGPLFFCTFLVPIALELQTLNSLHLFGFHSDSDGLHYLEPHFLEDALLSWREDSQDHQSARCECPSNLATFHPISSNCLNKYPVLDEGFQLVWNWWILSRILYSTLHTWAWAVSLKAEAPFKTRYCKFSVFEAAKHTSSS